MMFLYICSMPLFKRISLFVLLVMSCLANAQTLKFEQFTTKEGLLSDEVYNLHQDKKGYIWIFTHYGPLKYNGTEFIPVLKNLPFTESIIYAIYENKEGRKWVANSKKNIYEIVNDSAFIVEGTQKYSDKLREKANEIYQMYVDDSLNIYVKTHLFTYKLRKEGKNYTMTNMAKALASDSCEENVLNFGDALMSIQKMEYLQGMLERSGKKVRFCDGLEPLKGVEVSFAASYYSKYYKRFGDYTYFNYLNNMMKVGPDLRVKDIFTGEQVLNFTKDANNHLWVACYRNGLLEYDEHDSLVHHYFKGKTINDVLPDKYNGLWVSTDGAGIYHCRNIDELYYEKDSPFGKPVNTIKEIGGKVFVGTTDFNLFFLEKNKVHRVDKAANDLPDDPLWITPYKSFFLVCYRLHYELLQYRNGKFSASGPPLGISYQGPLEVIEYSADTILFLARNRVGIVANASNLYNTKQSHLKNIRIEGKAYCIQKYKEMVFLGTDRGVFCVKRDTILRLPYLKALEACVVTRMRTDSMNNFWFCTQGNGLFCLDNQKHLTHYTSVNGLPGNIVNDLFFMKDGRFLLSNNKGLYYYKGHSAAALDVGRRLVEGEVQTATIYKDKIYVGTKTGLILIDTRTLGAEPTVSFNLNAAFVNDKQVSAQKLRSLSYKENNLKFKFDVISFQGEKYGLKYILNNTTVDSGTVTDDVVDLKRLSPGSYTLTVKPLGINEQKEITIFFTIVPAFWQTAWFMLLMIFAGLVLIVLTGWTLFRYYKVRALRKSEGEKLIAEYRLIALKAQINPHFMSNCIAAIQHLILQNKVDEANEYLAKFSFMVRQVLNLSNKSLVPLKEEIEIIELYIKLERLRFDKINVEFYVDPAIDRETTLIPPLLAQPILENAIWHGLLALKASRIALLSLFIKAEPGRIKIVIEDNGVGRASSTGGIGNSRDSKGIAITRQRIENLKFISGQDLAELAYEDLYEEDGSPAGTRVTISLPDNLHI